MAYVDNTEKMELKDSFSEPDSLKVDEYTEADYVEMDECKMELLLMAHVEKAPDQTSWFLDSGCSNCQCILWQEYQQYMATKL
jgi:hypothetical protein